MVETVVAFFKEYLTSEMIVFIVSLMPILELRGGLVAASLLGLPWMKAASIAVIGNLLPVPFIVFFIEKILEYLAKHGPIKNLARTMMKKGRSKGLELQNRYPNSILLGLFLFVGIPLPGTGAWTGSLIAAFLGVKPKNALWPIALGVLLACLIMSVLSYALPGAFGLK
ncbi:hypothetical protein D3H64_05095 [Atopobacter sp. AH10]|uniref:COG2426 family protein n=1 Tax=Atopobacter sp. AH10 TaxID=2315861 RepID=UPI000EF2561F|nr:small multi-drug export protein [Atopobacter sp. AH10]RLK63359.1 hypothetical protein D3H64_05095 [Atopobacter sp. AH10]